jgi:hypothetical protein
MILRFLTFFCVSALAPLAMAADAFPELHRLGFIVVTPDGPTDGGDFGKNTPGTRTAGIQEALDHAKSINTRQHRSKNIWIACGDYHTSETITVPWMGERLLIQADQSWIIFDGERGDALVIDSQMNSRMYFGYVSALNCVDGWVVRIKPVDPGPSAPLPKERRSAVFTCSDVQFNAIVAKGMFEPGKVDKRSNGLLLDGSAGPIIMNRFVVSEINTCDVGVELKGNCGANALSVWFNHGCNTHLLVGKAAAQNTINMAITSDGVPESVGARIFGQKNTFNLTVFLTSAGRNVIFEPPARDNIVRATDLPNGMTDRADQPSSNRIVENGQKASAKENEI